MSAITDQLIYSKGDAMKKIICVLISAAVMLMLCSCSSENNDKPSDASKASSVSDERSRSSEAEPESSIDYTLGKRLFSSFGKIWGSDTYYLDVGMTVEGLSTTNEEGSVELSNKTNYYRFQIAIDKEKSCAFLKMSMPDNTTGHLVIKDGKCYNLADDEKTYQSQTYPEDINTFGKRYTTDGFLGVINNLQLSQSGKESIRMPNENESFDADYEKYNYIPADSAQGSGASATVCYYFRNDEPCVEVFDTDRGRTTFVFYKVSTDIPDRTVFDIPADYHEKKQSQSSQ